MLKPGDPAPDFTATACDGSRIRLGDFRGRKVLLWFFPKADTPG
jgi:peroxiredoxin Q/BCP